MIGLVYFGCEDNNLTLSSKLFLLRLVDTRKMQPQKRRIRGNFSSNERVWSALTICTVVLHVRLPPASCVPRAMWTGLNVRSCASYTQTERAVYFEGGVKPNLENLVETAAWRLSQLLPVSSFLSLDSTHNRCIHRLTKSGPSLSRNNRPRGIYARHQVYRASWIHGGKYFQKNISANVKPSILRPGNNFKVTWLRKSFVEKSLLFARTEFPLEILRRWGKC